VKVVAKVAVQKPVAKAPVKAVAKPAAKPVVKAVAPKVAPKAVSKPAKPVAKTPVKAAAPVKPVAKTGAKSAPVVVAPKAKVPAPMPTPVPKAAPAPVAPAVSAVPLRAGRPSSRLAQLTVPSMAQSVASTAAKASYSQSAPTPVIVPALPSSIKKDPKLANNWKTKPLAELTDADLMAMPDSEYMNDVQMAAFRLKLSILKQDMLNNAGETTEHLREDTSVVPDPADRATIEEEHALELRTRDRERKLLKKIEQSIGRIDAGDYGYCDETGEAIGVGRLLARPTATLSLEAQQRRELKQKMFGD
jgi:DnaK suppressor protein